MVTQLIQEARESREDFAALCLEHKFFERAMTRHHVPEMNLRLLDYYSNFKLRVSSGILHPGGDTDYNFDYG